MAHQNHLEKLKYRQWVKAGLGLGYFKEGLAPFCRILANQQHQDMLKDIRRDRRYCHCFYPYCQNCQNNICYFIESEHVDRNPNWDNADIKYLKSDPWSVAKCYIFAGGYINKATAKDTDSSGLLSVILNNRYFQRHISGPLNIFKKVLDHRNSIFHSSSQELGEATANSYIDDMITVLQDPKELVTNPDAQQAVRNLQELKNKDFIITSENLEKLLKQVAESTQQTIKDEVAKSAKTTQQLVKQTKDEVEKSAESTQKLVKHTKDEVAKSAETTQQLVKQTKDEVAKLAETTQQIVTQTKNEVAKSAETTQQLVTKTKDEVAKSAETTQQLVTQTKDEVAKSAETTQQLVTKTKDEVAKSAETTQQLVTQTKDEVAKSAKTTQQLVKQTKDEVEKSAESTQKLVKHTKDEVAKSAETTQQLVKQTKDEVAKLAETTQQIVTQTKNEVAKSAETTQQLVTKTKDEVAKSAETTQQLVTQTKDEVLKHTNEMKRKMDTLISDQEEIKKKQRVEESPDEKQLKYEKTKSDLQRQMIERYRKTLLQVPVIPTNQKTYIRSFDEIYIRPTITREVKGEKGKTEEKVVNSMSEIFTKNGVPLKSIYVVGDAGTGKSSFCNYLVNCWCMAHSEGQIAENEFGGVKEMKKFDILFYVDLRRYQNVVKIHEMLEKHYNSNILNELLNKESEKVIILLDGLDEWSSATITDNQFQTEGLPEQHYLKNYTIVTTSRPWKIHTLEISEKEIQQMLKLKGFDDKSKTIMIYRTIKHINSDRGDTEDILMCKGKLNENSLRSLKQVPIMLQQLICLWIDGKLDKSSKCAVYTEMLELFLKWNEKKGTGKVASSPIKVHLPQYLVMKRKCKSNGHLIHDMSQLAYKTLFKCSKDQSLTFDIDVLEQLEISDEIRESCLKIGLLTEDRCPSLFVSEPPSSMFSFIHKSVQEFLAAVNIAINYKTKIDSSNNPGNAETQRGCTQFVQEVFKNCSTVNEILEQSNVVIMLCGLEPRLATHVSRYIYDIVNKDPLVQRYRRTVDSDIRKYSSDYRFLVDIQNLIFDSMKEYNASNVENRPTFHIGDLYIDDDDDDDDDSCDIICSSIDQQQVTPDCVRSIYVDDFDTEIVKFSKYLPKFKHLEKIIIDYDIEDLSSTESFDTMIDEVNKSVAETIRINTTTLKSLSLSGTGSYNDKLDSLCKNVVPLLPSMNNLVAIKMTYIEMSHHDTSRLCKFLKGTSHLEQFHIDIECECRKQHDVDLSNYQRLQYLEFGGCLCVTFTDTVNLEVFKCLNIKSTNYMKIFDSIVKCDKLKKLYLNLDRCDKSVSYHTSITERLVSVLPLLHNLNKLVLRDFRLTDNIIQVPSEIKSLKDINLYGVRMSLTTWKKFVDSLPSIPHTVDVELDECDITGDGEECNVDWLSYRLRGVMRVIGIGIGVVEGVVRGEKGNEAIQYVKDQKQLFNVKRDNPWFVFSTIK